MKRSELLILGLIQQTGWTVLKEREEDGSSWWRAIPPKATEDAVTALDVVTLFEKWCERDSVLESIFKIKVNLEKHHAGKDS